MTPVGLFKIEYSSVFVGFGHDLALKCVENGMPVFAGCLTEQGIKGIKEEAKRIRNGEKLLHTIQLNICSEESVKNMREYIDKTGLGLWAVVNNAGVGDNRACKYMVYF